ncbi:MAG: Rrf2 family transcriptional regulator [Ignavibacteriae bacterium]|nr:Rrf2 family transcriptional regulator [Ignavibacteriota bacterium]
MKFSSQEEYGLRCLLQLARRGGTGAGLTIGEISREEGLSAAYVAKLMRLLRLGGFVDSVRGQEGGYSLSRPADSILVSDVLIALGGKVYEHDFCEHYSGTEDSCLHTVSCSIRPLWRRVQEAIDTALRGLTIADLLPSRDVVSITLERIEQA